MAENQGNYPILDNELERLKRLYSYDILGTKNEEQFDNLTQLASQILGLPICQITLMDADWQDFISNEGIDMDGNQRELSFCQYTVVQNQILEIKDTTEDPRFKEHPFVQGQPHIRYYVGAPLVDDDGLVMGTLCGYGMEVNALSDEKKKMLTNISKTVMRLIRYRKANKDLTRYVNIFSLNQDLLCVISKDGYLKLINPSFENLLGWSEEELLSNPLVKYVHKLDRHKVNVEFKNIKYGNANKDFSCRILTKSGDTLWFDWSYFSDEDSSVIVASGHNMSQVLETQNSLKQAIKKLNRASRIKDAFLSNMSHEIRTPLSAISGFTDLISKTKLDKEQKQYAETIEIASSHLMNIVNDVLDIYKLEEGKIRLENRSLNPRLVASKVMKLFKHLADKKGLQLVNEVGRNVPKIILCDETRLMQILTNLIGNAVKFTDKGQVSLKISTSKLLNQKATLKFEVEDTGVGISEDNLARVFERFSQAESSTTRLYGGTGLGLSISRHLIKLYKGKIDAQSELGKGTKILFEIPFKLGQETLPKEKTKTEPSKYSFRVLLAEDNEHLQLLSKIHIEKCNGSVDVASTGLEAINLLKKEQYDVILMDVQMPEMDGITATTILRNDLKIQTPVIGFSANLDSEELMLCKKAGMNDFISKPFSVDDLQATIRKYSKLENFDWAITQLELKEGKELVSQFIEIFKTRVPKDIIELKQLIENKEPIPLKQKAHFLASTFRSLNFKEGEDLTDKIQEKVKNNSVPEALETSSELVNYLEKAVQHLIKTS